MICTLKCTRIKHQIISANLRVVSILFLEPNQAKTLRYMHHRNYTRKNNTYFIFISTEPPKNMKNMFMQLQEIAFAYILNANFCNVFLYEILMTILF